MIDRTMSYPNLPEWFTDLLLLRATDGLDEEQQKQFDQFLIEHPDRDQIELQAEKYELTAAAIDLGIENMDPERSDSSMPDALRQKVLNGAKRHFEPGSVPPVPMREPESSTTPAPTVARNQDGGLTTREALAWLAAAAAIVVLLTGLNPFAASQATPVAKETQIQTPETYTVEELFEEFVSGEFADLIRLPWTATDENSSATGEVVWRDSAGEGFMVFDGLAVNDPLLSQYQLWIFDTSAGDPHPVDGGVFDVGEDQPVIVPIDARIPVTKAVMFAVTEEKPGGVVVSDRERLPLLAE